MMAHPADDFLSSDEEQVPFDNLAAGYQLLADHPGDASPDSVTEPSVAEIHSGTSSSNGSDYDEGASNPLSFGCEAADFPALAARLLTTSGLQHVPATTYVARLARGSQEQALSSDGEGNRQIAHIGAASKADDRFELGATSRQAAGPSSSGAGEHEMEDGHSNQPRTEVETHQSSTANSPAPQYGKAQPWQAQEAGKPTAAAGSAVLGEMGAGSGSSVEIEDDSEEGRTSNTTGSGIHYQRKRGSKPSVLDDKQRMAVLQAMQSVQLAYRPAWADVVPEEGWVQRLHELRQGQQDDV